jgi:hypothetical protein
MFVGETDGVVVNDQTGPAVDPLLFFATTCQKYTVPFVSPVAAYEALAWPVDTCGGGFVVPNFTS